MTTFAVPGQVLGQLTTYLPGTGTYVSENNIHAALAGLISTTPADPKASQPTVSISSPSHISSASASSLPTVSSTIIARVLRVQQRQLIASILVVNPSSSNTSINTLSQITDDETQFQAILRREDVRAYEKDKVVMNESFRVGDILKASVISLGDEKSYYISTAGNEFGVCVARSEAGNPMVPVSWKEMRDVVTGKGEGRKVAKPS